MGSIGDRGETLLNNLSLLQGIPQQGWQVDTRRPEQEAAPRAGRDGTAAHWTYRAVTYFPSKPVNSLDDPVKVPMMQDIKDYHDIDLYVSGGMSARYWNWCGIPLVSWGTGTGLLPFVGPYYDPQRGPIFGYVGGASQGGEMEVWTGYLGDGIKTNDAKNLGIIVLCIIIIIGNLSMLGDKEGKK